MEYVNYFTINLGILKENNQTDSALIFLSDNIRHEKTENRL